MTEADRELLRAEGCLVDAEAAASRMWDESALPGMVAAPMSSLGKASRLRQVALAGSALRAAGLEPGEPALHLILAAIERRGWWWDHWRDHGANGYGANVAPEGDWPTGSVRYDADPTTALALAFCAATRLTEGAG